MPAKGREMALGMVRTFTARSKYYLTFPYSLTFLHWICFTFGVKNNINKGREKRKPEERKEKQLEAPKQPSSRTSQGEKSVRFFLLYHHGMLFTDSPCPAARIWQTPPWAVARLKLTPMGHTLPGSYCRGRSLCFVGVCSYCFLNYALFYSLVS